MPRYLAPIVGSADRSKHLAAALQLAARAGGQITALVIGKVPSSLQIGADVPDRWSRLEFEAARVRRAGQDQGLEVETVLVLSDSVAAAAVLLAAEFQADAICLAYDTGLLAALRRWRDPLWRTILAAAPCAVVAEILRVNKDQPAFAKRPFGAAAHSRPSTAPPGA